MTNEEAIEILQEWIDKGFEYESGYGLEALADVEEEACKLAIKALEDKGYDQGWADGYAYGIGGEDD